MFDEIAFFVALALAIAFPLTVRLLHKREERRWEIRNNNNPMKRRRYVTSESHLGGYRLVIGFDSLDEVHAAQNFICGLPQTTANTDEGTQT